MGGPKALIQLGPSRLVERAIAAASDGGCAHVLVVVGAAGDAVETYAAAAGAEVVRAPAWREGMGASLRAGLGALSAQPYAAALVTLVDLPDVTPGVVARVLGAVGEEPEQALVRAAYAGTPGHPVILGRDYWPEAIEAARGDRGARDLFDRQPPRLVECGDLATGRDADRPDDL